MSAPENARSDGTRDRQVLRVILVEGIANVAVLVLKLAVGLTTGSMAILADAVHSLTDVANNIIAWLVMRAAQRPADREHPYGHQKFEMIAVFVLAVILATIAIEIAVRALTHAADPPVLSAWGLFVMFAVLAVNIAIAAWQRHWAIKLRSSILEADASHTFSDVLTTVVVIAGWQLAAYGLHWIDTACALGVAAIILYLAFGLFRNVVPTLVDEYAVEPERLTAAVLKVPGVIDVPRVRSRWIGSERAVDVIVTVAPSLPTSDAHEIADAVEQALETEFDVGDTTVHVEPDATSRDQ